MARRLRVLAAAALAAAALAAVQPASASPQEAPLGVRAASATAASGTAAPGTALAYLQAHNAGLDRNWENFSIATRLLTDLKKAGSETRFVSRLWSPRVPGTTFLVPTDRAFQILLQLRTGVSYTSEAALLRQLEKMYTADVNILLGHGVLLTRLTQRQVIGLGGRDLRSAWTSYSGAKIHVAVYRPRTGTVVSLWDQDRGLRNPRLILARGNLNAGSPQLVHGIDRVLWGFSVPMENRTWFPGGQRTLGWDSSPCTDPPDNPFYCSGLPNGAPGHGG